MTPQEDLLLLPIITLATWSVFMALWMFATRIPAMLKAEVTPEAGKHPADFKNTLSSQVRAISDNFSNLFELPVAFYAVAVVVFLAGHVDMIAIYLAWGFVGLRILHSLIQATYNHVLHRFSIYMLALFCLLGLSVREILNLLG